MCVTSTAEVKTKLDPVFAAKSTEEAWCSETSVRKGCSEETCDVEISEREGEDGVSHVACVEFTTAAAVNRARSFSGPNAHTYEASESRLPADSSTLTEETSAIEPKVGDNVPTVISGSVE